MDYMPTLIRNYADARYDNIFHTAKNVHDNAHDKKSDSIYMKMTYRYLSHAKKIGDKAILNAVDKFLFDSYASRSKEDREKTASNIEKKTASNIEKKTLVEGAVTAGVAAYQPALSEQKRIGGGKRRTKHRNTKSRKRRATKSRKLRR